MDMDQVSVVERPRRRGSLSRLRLQYGGYERNIGSEKIEAAFAEGALTAD